MSGKAKYADVTETETVTSEMQQSRNSHLATILGLLKFFSVNRDRPGVFVSTYLLLAGWQEERIGHVTFIRSMISLFVQTPIGDLIDKSHRKREYLAAACLLVALTGVSAIFFLDYLSIAIAMAIQGVSLAVIAPAIYGLTLGLVGAEKMSEQTALNEMCDHAGTVIFAAIAGILAYFYDDTIIFWVVLGMAIITLGCLLMIRPHMIDHDRARGLVIEETPAGTSSVDFKPVSYTDILRDRNIICLLLTIFMFHFGNAAMLPLLGQMLATGNGRSGIPFTAACIVISQATMVPTASWVGSKVKTIGTKPIFIAGMSLIPLRGVLVLTFMSLYPSQELLLTTQILDGLASGIYAVLCVLVTEDLTRGSGRFNFVFGLVNTVHAVGDAFSNLAAQNIAGGPAGYTGAFLLLSFSAIIPVLIYSFGMKDKDRTLTSSSHSVSVGVIEAGNANKTKSLDSSGTGKTDATATVKNPINSAVAI